MRIKAYFGCTRLSIAVFTVFAASGIAQELPPEQVLAAIPKQRLETQYQVGQRTDPSNLDALSCHRKAPKSRRSGTDFPLLKAKTSM